MVRHGKRKNAQKKFEHPSKPVVYYSMNNLDWIIEGTKRHCGVSARAKVSDLSPFPLSERFDARLHGAGINDEEYAGQRDNTASAAFSVLAACSAAGGMGGACSLLDSRKPHVEKGMHTRSQQSFSSRSRMGRLCADAHVRGVAVAQRLHSDLFGGGEIRHENAEALAIWGV